MTLRDVMKTSLSNLSRHKVRTVLSAVGVTVGILTIVTMLSLGIGVKREIVETFRSVGLETIEVRPVTEDSNAFNQFAQPQRTLRITPELVEEMRAREDVEKVYPRMYEPWGSKVYLKLGGESLRVYVRESNEYSRMNNPFTGAPEVVAGEELPEAADGVIVVSTRALEALGYDEDEYESLIGQDVALTLSAPRGENQEFPLRLVGVVDTYHEGHPRTYVGLEDMVALNAWWFNDPDFLEHEGYDVLIVKALSLNDASQIIDVLQERGFQVESLKMMLQTTNKAMVILQTMLGSIGGLALMVAAIGIANTMVMSVYERTREIGVLKAVGASSSDVRLLFMVEAALIGLLGGVVGVIGGWLLGLGLNEAILIYLRWKEIPMTGTFFMITGWLVALALIFATVVGLLAGLYPAVRAARLNPVDALRYE